MATRGLKPAKDEARLEECQQVIGYRFRKLELLRAALTHTSGANSRAASNERLEFLGDSVLGLVVSERIYERFPEYQEGELTNIKSVIVSRKTCAQLSGELRLKDFLVLGKGLASAADVPANVLANVFESLVAAIYLDGGWEAARAFVLAQIEPVIQQIAQQALPGNSKSLLQQLAQKEYGSIPRYHVLDEQGPDHDKCFKVAAEIGNHHYPPAWGRNKKEAELKAAMNALAEIAGDPIPFTSH